MMYVYLKITAITRIMVGRMLLNLESSAPKNLHMILVIQIAEWPHVSLTYRINSIGGKYDDIGNTVEI
jgi:hypothetical protein